MKWPNNQHKISAKIWRCHSEFWEIKKFCYKYIPCNISLEWLCGYMWNIRNKTFVISNSSQTWIQSKEVLVWVSHIQNLAWHAQCLSEFESKWVSDAFLNFTLSHNLPSSLRWKLKMDSATFSAIYVWLCSVRVTERCNRCMYSLRSHRAGFACYSLCVLRQVIWPRFPKCSHLFREGNDNFSNWMW